MELGLTFGSIGDFIAITVLIKDIVAALDDARGSAKEYQDLVRELDKLRSTLEEVQKTFEDPRLIHSLEDLAKSALDTVAQTNDCLKEFLVRICKYEPALSTGASGKRNCLKSVGRKVQWKLNERELGNFYDEVKGCTIELNILLKLITIRILQRNHDVLVKEQTAAESRTAALIRQSEASLEKWISFIGRQIISQLQTVHRSGIELKRSVGQIITVTFAISSEVSIIRAIVMGLDKGPSDEYFTLEDITGRMFPIHLSTITSWSVLEFILSERFKGKKGARRVQRKLYSLRESNTQREIDKSIPWESAFLPHQKITMSLICKDAENNKTGGRGFVSCPFCKAPSDHISGVEVECATCKRYFTRIVELDDFEAPRHTIRSGHSIVSSEQHERKHHPSGSKSCKICHPSGPHGTETISKQSYCLPGTDSDTDSDDGDVRSFVRVRLISRQRRATIKPLKLEIPNQSDPPGLFELGLMSEAGSSVHGVGRSERLVESLLSSKGIGVSTTLGCLSSPTPPLVIPNFKRNYQRTSVFGDYDSEVEDGKIFIRRRIVGGPHLHSHKARNIFRTEN